MPSQIFRPGLLDGEVIFYKQRLAGRRVQVGRRGGTGNAIGSPVHRLLQMTDGVSLIRENRPDVDLCP